MVDGGLARQCYFQIVIHNLDFLSLYAKPLKRGAAVRHPYEKFIRIELVSMISAVLIGIIALIKGYLILIFMCFFLIVLSLLTEAITLWFTYQKLQSGKQLIRAVIILILTIYLVFKW